jgi:hypothetical protein
MYIFIVFSASELNSGVVEPQNGAVKSSGCLQWRRGGSK